MYVYIFIYILDQEDLSLNTNGYMNKKRKRVKEPINGTIDNLGIANVYN